MAEIIKSDYIRWLKNAVTVLKKLIRRRVHDLWNKNIYVNT